MAMSTKQGKMLNKSDESRVTIEDTPRSIVNKKTIFQCQGVHFFVITDGPPHLDITLNTKHFSCFPVQVEP